MDIQAALDQAKLILNEEEKRPTLEYRYVSNAWPAELIWNYRTLSNQGYTASGAGMVALYQERDKRPRSVRENPAEYAFESTNYGLLITVLGQIQARHHPLFIKGVLAITVQKAVPQVKNSGFPAWNSHPSALPLLAEFCIRNGFFNLLIEGLNSAKLPNPSIAGMFRQLEEMISLNFDIFSDAELASMQTTLSQTREVAERQTWSSRAKLRRGPMVNNPHYRQGFSSVGREIVESVNGFLKQCEQARYFYLKGILQQTRNPEVEGDKKAVEDFLTRLGFDELMVRSLNAAEHGMRSAATAFELKSAMGHLRSFLEQLHLQACGLLVQPAEVAPDKWGSATLFLRDRNVISLKEEQFITTLYTLVSDEGIHPLIAEREYARLFRNIVIEYGLLFLTTLQKRNVKVTPANP